MYSVINKNYQKEICHNFTNRNNILNGQFKFVSNSESSYFTNHLSKQTFRKEEILTERPLQCLARCSNDGQWTTLFPSTSESCWTSFNLWHYPGIIVEQHRRGRWWITPGNRTLHNKINNSTQLEDFSNNVQLS